jgi:hypothetical protein
MKAAEVLVLQGASTGLCWNASSMGLSFYLHSKDKKQMHRIFLIIFSNSPSKYQPQLSITIA